MRLTEDQQLDEIGVRSAVNRILVDAINLSSLKSGQVLFTVEENLQAAYDMYVGMHPCIQARFECEIVDMLSGLFPGVVIKPLAKV